MIKIRQLSQDELPNIWTIDRAEIIENIYYFREGQLVLEPEYYDMQGWPTGEPEHYAPFLEDCFERGGFFWGAFEGETLVGVAILEEKFIGSKKDTLQLKFLHVDKNVRKTGLGRRLFSLAAEQARGMGAAKLYISSTPSENTVHFYQYLGCVLAEEVDAELFAFEPEDIHLEYTLR
ncbi:MAG: GNAT family N-acetyltransferase [Anaerolineae bacterium]|jgi:predicted N-acetyltransferase YhbS|nr:GNAT family N-acetyltransferase [Anaerolineae bacterium]MBT7072574.1 GNAT family N-acetyltransferase [Anaerolineae bacterium]MBT7324600.1 GNAT family N-acetyltransferase [Anaerolineae bacterium]